MAKILKFPTTIKLVPNKRHYFRKLQQAIKDVRKEFYNEQRTTYKQPDEYAKAVVTQLIVNYMVGQWEY